MNEHISGFNPLLTQATFTINSFTFIFYSFLAIIFARLARDSKFETVAICFLNIVFLSFVINSFYDAFVLLSLCLGIYWLGKIDGIFKTSLGIFRFGCVLFLWITLFLIKDPHLFSSFNPFFYFPAHILGLSYIIFRGISYLMEHQLVRQKGFFDFFSYIFYFPTLISGPIERYMHFTNQKKKVSSEENLSEIKGFNRVLNGFIKKFVLADNLMSFGIFSLAQEPSISLPLLWLGALIMLFLIYLDFSGYCDIMIGISELMGIKIAENFNRPFISKNIQEFWTRWHISLGSIIQDYVFTPINKFIILNTPSKIQFTLITLAYLLSMVLVALWHGTTLGFLIFGLLHGGVLVLFQLKKKYFKTLSKNDSSQITIYTSRLLTYSFVSISLIWWYGEFLQAINTYKLLFGL